MNSPIRSLPTVRLNGWDFKASESNGGIVIVAFSTSSGFSIVQYFTTEDAAHKWIDYIMMKSVVVNDKPII